MKKRSKRYKEIRKKVDPAKSYKLEEAVGLIKDTASAKFGETVELSVKLGIDPRHADQLVRGTTNLPHGTGKEVRVLVFAEGDKARDAQEAGADHVGSDDLIEKIGGGWFDFDVVIAVPDMMKKVSKLGKVLGPRRLMPSPKSGTVTNDVGKTVESMKAGQIEFRNDKLGAINVSLGKSSFTQEALFDNTKALLDAIVKARPSATKGQYLKSAYLSSTMGPGIRLDALSVTKAP